MKNLASIFIILGCVFLFAPAIQAQTVEEIALCDSEEYHPEITNKNVLVKGPHNRYGCYQYLAKKYQDSSLCFEAINKAPYSNYSDKWQRRDVYYCKIETGTLTVFEDLFNKFLVPLILLYLAAFFFIAAKFTGRRIAIKICFALLFSITALWAYVLGISVWIVAMVPVLPVLFSILLLSLGSSFSLSPIIIFLCSVISQYLFSSIYFMLYDRSFKKLAYLFAFACIGLSVLMIIGMGMMVG